MNSYNYYIVSKESGQIIEVYTSLPTNEQLADAAYYCEAEVYVIEGQHCGLTMTYADAKRIKGQ